MHLQQHRTAKSRNSEGIGAFHALAAEAGNKLRWSDKTMASIQEQYDDAMFDFSQGDYDACIGKLKDMLAADPKHFDAQMAVGMAYYRKGEFQQAIAEGEKAAQLNPREQLVHTNLSLFYMKAGDKQKAEHHGLQARISSWRSDKSTGPETAADPELQMAKPPGPKPPENFPEMPWKKKPAP